MGYIVVSRGTHTQHTAGLLGDGDLLSIRKQAGTGTSSQFDSKRAGTGTSIRKQGVTHPLLATHDPLHDPLRTWSPVIIFTPTPSRLQFSMVDLVRVRVRVRVRV